MPALTQPPLERLAALVKARRLQLGYTAERLASEAGVTPKTYGQVEAGARRARDITYSRIEGPLGWAAGSCIGVLDGGSPTLIEPAPTAGASISPVASGDLESDISQAVQLAAIALDGTDLTASDIRTLKEQVVEELRRRGHLTDPDQS